MQAAALKQEPPITMSFREATEDDIPALVEAGRRFFEESEFPEFADFSADNFAATLRTYIEYPQGVPLLAIYGDEVAGFLIFTLDAPYTTKPLALLFLFYVAPEHRRSPLGRILLDTACEIARSRDAVAFYAGAMARLSEREDRMLMNMLRKQGFKDLGGWAKKVL